MNLVLQRDVFTDLSTSGEVFIDGEHECYTLELPNKDGKPGSCIPQGTYRIELQPSPKFMRSTDPWVQKYAHRMPHINGISGRSLIMFHWGNRPEDTDGCVLTGTTRDPDFIGQSRPAFEKFFDKIFADAESGNCFVTVLGGAKPPNNASAVNEAINEG